MIPKLEPIHPDLCARSTFRTQRRHARRSDARRKISTQADGTAYQAATSPPHATSDRKKVVIVGGTSSCFHLRQRDHSCTHSKPCARARQLIGLRSCSAPA